MSLPPQLVFPVRNFVNTNPGLEEQAGKGWRFLGSPVAVSAGTNHIRLFSALLMLWHGNLTEGEEIVLSHPFQFVFTGLGKRTSVLLWTGTILGKHFKLSLLFVSKMGASCSDSLNVPSSLICKEKT